MALIRQLNITPEEAEAGKGMAVLAYVIFFVPLLIEDTRKNKFAMYHMEQALLLLILNLCTIIITTITCGIGGVLIIPLLIFYILGIVNAAKGEAKPLPLIGQYGEKFNLVK